MEHLNNNAQEKDELADRQPDSELEEAIERVYRKYGPDLKEFVRDVQKDLQKRAASDCTYHRPFLL